MKHFVVIERGLFFGMMFKCTQEIPGTLIPPLDMITGAPSVDSDGIVNYCFYVKQVRIFNTFEEAKALRDRYRLFS